MHRHATHPTYAYPPQQQTAPAAHRYSGTSSAFSASANPNEDWTKISDLAERRRIQNRIAQRNYRKKLKKRLEDLERRAASNSASPEQRPAELHRPESQQQQQQPPHGYQHLREAADSDRHEYSRHHEQYQGNPYPPQYGHEEGGMFSQRATRQLSTSPPPFSYSSYPTPESVSSYSSYPPPSNYHSLPATTAPESSSYSPYLPPLSSVYPNTLPSMVHPVKQEYYHEEDVSPFSMSYASMAGIDIPAPIHYADSSSPQTPPLSHSFEASVAGSPPNYPTTPGSVSGSPPLRMVHHC